MTLPTFKSFFPITYRTAFFATVVGFTIVSFLGIYFIHKEIIPVFDTSSDPVLGANFQLSTLSTGTSTLPGVLNVEQANSTSTFAGNLVAKSLTAQYIIATSTSQASAFPYSSSTALTATNLFSTTATSTSLFSTTANIGTLTFPGITDGLLSTNSSGVVVATTSFGVSNLLLAKDNFLVGNDAGVAHATSSIFVSSTGNVGIGVTDPQTALVVDTTSRDGTAGVFSGSQLTLRSLRSIIADTDATRLVGGINFDSNDTNLTAPGTTTAAIRALAELGHTAAQQPTRLAFYTTAAGGTATSTEKMTILGSGNVGIGTTTPTALLGIGGIGTLFELLDTAGSMVMRVVSSTATLLGIWNFSGATSVSLPAGAGGRSITINSTAIDADAELYTDSWTFNYASSTYATSSQPVLLKLVPQAATISTITCWAQDSDAATSTIMFEERTTPWASGTDVLYGVGILAGSNVVSASSTLANSTLASGSYLAMMSEGYLLGTPNFPVCDVKYTYDD